MEGIVFVLEVIGTIAFASSGAIVGIHKKMDIFGVMVMAITTAVGGGIIRDVVLGILPPAAFMNPVYVIIAVICSLVIFAVLYTKRHFEESKPGLFYEKLMSIMDAIGLGVFTTIGIEKAYEIGYDSHIFLLLFVGIVTGVGGGLIRDIMAQEMPFIFVKHIYACASLVGALVCIFMMPYSRSGAMIAGTIVVILIRLLAMKYKWNLPRIDS